MYDVTFENGPLGKGQIETKVLFSRKGANLFMEILSDAAFLWHPKRSHTHPGSQVWGLQTTISDSPRSLWWSRGGRQTKGGSRSTMWSPR